MEWIPAMPSLKSPFWERDLFDMKNIICQGIALNPAQSCASSGHPTQHAAECGKFYLKGKPIRPEGAGPYPVAYRTTLMP